MNLDGDALGDGNRADQVADAVDEVKAADEVLIVVRASIHKGPDRARVLLLHEGEFLAVGLEEATWAVAIRPTGIGVEMIDPQRIAVVEFVRGKFYDRRGCVHAGSSSSSNSHS